MEIMFGAMCPPISKQLKQQQIFIDKKECSKFQKISDSISMLAIHGIISQKESEVYKQRLYNQISKVVTH